MKNIFKEKKMKNLIYPRQNGKLLMALLMALFLFSCRSDEPDATDPDPPDLVCKAGSNDNCQEIFLTNAGIRCPDGLARVSERCTGERLATCDNGAGIRWDYFGYDAFQLVSEQQTCESMGHTWAPQSDPPVSFGVNVTTPDMSVTTESGRSVTFTFVLTGQPTANVVITPRSSDTGEGTVSGALLFTSDNWNTPQPLTITGVNDDIADGNQSYQITFTVSSADTNYEGLELSSVDVTNSDNNTPGITLIVVDSTTSESDNDNTGTIHLVLNTQPTADVTITPASSDAGEGTVSGALTFTTSNWDTEQQVNVTGINDEIADGDQNYQITFAVMSTDANYNNFSLNPAGMTNADNDTAGVTLTPPSDSATTEAGGTVTFDVVLTTQPTDNVVITLASSDTGEGTVNPETLTFTTSDWATPQTVTVTGVNDNIDDGDQSYQITFTVMSDDTNYNELPVSLEDITNTDDDTAAFMVVASPTGDVGEDVGEVTYTVSLSRGPLSDVTVDYQITGTMDLADYSVTAVPLSSTSLTTFPRGGTLNFTPTNWTTAQTVTVTVTDDAVDENNETLIFTLINPTGGTELSATSASVTTTIQDDDTRGVKVDTDLVMTGDQNTLTVAEGSTGTYTVVLTSQPTATVTVTVGGASSGVSVAPTSLTFTTSNWDDAQTVTVTAAEDANAVDEMVTLTNTASSTGGGYGSSETASVMVTVDDNDTRGVVASKTALSVTEGSTGEYTVALATQPTAAVTVTVGGVSGDVSVDTDTMTTGNQNTLTFTTSNWDDAQTVTVTAAQDEDLLNDPVVTLTHSAMGGDYDGSETAGMVMVTIVEDDKATFTVTGPATVAENVLAAVYTVSLSAQPAQDVTVDYAITGTATLDSDYMFPAPSESLTTASSGTLSFTTMNWNTDQLITLRIVNDTLDDDGETIIFTLSNPSPGTAAQVSGSPSVTTTIVDDDNPEVMASFGAATSSVTEGGSTTVTVTLSAPPERLVLITLTTTNGAGAEASDYNVSTSVTFTASETSKTVTFTSTSDDVDEMDETVTLGFDTSQLPDRITASTTAGTTEVTIEDDDTRGLKVSGTGIMMSEGRLTLTVMEGMTATYMVELNSQPTEEVTVSLIAPGDGLLMVSRPSESLTTALDLTFTTSNWDDAQTVTVAAAEDDEDAVNDTVTLTNRASGGDYGPVSESVSVMITDNDTATFMFNPTPPMTVNENVGTVTYTVRLSARPAEDVTVNYVIAGGTATSGLMATPGVDYTLPMSSTSLTTAPGGLLTFTADTTDSMGRVTAGNWNTPQTITLTIVNDKVDEDGETIIFTLSNPTGGAQLPSGATSLPVTTTIEDNDTRGVTVSPTSLTVTEGMMADYTVVLTSQPTAGSVTVTVGGVSGDVSVSPTSLTFTAMNWNTAQTVTVSAAEDDDAVNDEDVTLTHTVAATGTGTDYGSVTAADSVTVMITDDDKSIFSVIGPETVGEGGETATYTVSLKLEPGNDVTVNYVIGGTATPGVDGVMPPPDVDIDYLLPASSTSLTTAPGGLLTFTAGSTGNWETPQTITLTTVSDTEAEDDETIIFMLRNPSPSDKAQLSGESSSVTTKITNWPNVKVSFGAATYSVTEGMTASVVVNLDMDPRRTVTIPLTVMNVSPTTSSDYTISATSVTFESGETSKTVTFTATLDRTAAEPDETVKLGFGTLPSGVTAGSTSSTEVTIPANNT